MTHRNERPDAGRHAHHDRLLIAAHAAGDLTGADLARATELLASCAECRALADELASIRSLTHGLPPAARPTGLDFRLTPEQAARLDRARGWRRLLRPFGTRSGASRPLAAAFTTLGVAGLLLAAVPGFLAGGFPGGAGGAAEIRQDAESYVPANAPDPEDEDGAEGSQEVPAGNVDTSTDGSGPPNGSGKDTMGGEPTAAPGRVTGGDSGGTPTPTEVTDLFAQESRGDSPSAPSPLLLLSVGFLGAGLGLFLLRLAARRLD